MATPHFPHLTPPQMHCREFRRKHDAYIDDTLSGEDLDSMANHRRVCERCGRLDTRIRRALLVARNVPSIQPSAGFSRRLHARLEQERRFLSLARHESPRPAVLSSATVGLLAVGVLLAAGFAGVMMLAPAEEHVARVAPVVAPRPDALPPSIAAPTMVASMSAGMPIWPAIYLAQEAPWHLASDGVSP